MSAWKSRAVKGAEQLNPGLDVYGCDGPELVLSDGSTVIIRSNTEQHQMIWKLTGCMHGYCHYRLCTSKALQSADGLWCPFCMYDSELWKQHGKALLPASEAAFMRLLLGSGLDAAYCHQVVSHFWHAPVDFYNFIKGFFVQVDGTCHWAGMHKLSSAEVIARDFGFNLAAMAAGACVVRVHDADIDNVAAVLAALAATAYGCSIVLTPSYATTTICYNGQKQAYVKVLEQLAPQHVTVVDGYGNCMLFKM